MRLAILAALFIMCSQIRAQTDFKGIGYVNATRVVDGERNKTSIQIGVINGSYVGFRFNDKVTKGFHFSKINEFMQIWSEISLIAKKQVSADEKKTLYVIGEGNGKIPISLIYIRNILGEVREIQVALMPFDDTGKVISYIIPNDWLYIVTLDLQRVKNIYSIP